MAIAPALIGAHGSNLLPETLDEPYDMHRNKECLLVTCAGSGFLLIYFVGVLTSLDNKGLLSQPNLKTAGASGGALSTVAVCSNVPVSTLKDAGFK